MIEDSTYKPVFQKYFEITPNTIANNLRFGLKLATSTKFVVFGTNIQQLHIYNSFFNFLYIIDNPEPDLIVNFGLQIDIYDDVLIVTGEDSNKQKMLMLFKLTDDEFTYVAKLYGYHEKGHSEQFADNISIFDNEILISDTGKNRVYLYSLIDRKLTLLQEFTPSNYRHEDIIYGIKIKISHNKIFIGSELDDGTKKIYIYTKRVNKWNPESSLIHGQDPLNYNLSAIEADNNALYIFSTPKDKDYSPNTLITVFNKSYSLYFNGSDSYIELHKTCELTSDFTIEAYIKIDKYIDKTSIVGYRVDSNETSVFGIEDSKLYYKSKDINGLYGSTTLELYQWYHVAIVRKDNEIKMFLNGKLENTTYSNYINPFNITTIGSQGHMVYLFKGNISNLRIVNKALYVNNFIMPSLVFSVLLDTELLIGTNEHFIDSTKKYVLKNIGNVFPSEVSPFNESWHQFDVIAAADNQPISFSANKDLIVLGNPKTSNNGLESGSALIYDRLYKQEFDLAANLYISTEFSHGGYSVKLYKHYILFCAVDEDIEDKINVGKVYVFRY